MEIVSNEEKLKESLGLFFDSLKLGDIILLNADLGLGKTTLVRKYLEHLDGLKSVEFSSPSYSLIQHYKLKDFSVYHIDLYRLENEDQLESVNLWETLENKDAIYFIEWPERINLIDLPQRTLYSVTIENEQQEGLTVRSYKIKNLQKV